MSIAKVKEEYEQELKMLQFWRTRLDTDSPEKDMSPSYRKGWRDYLLEVEAIGKRMIAMCKAAAETGDTKKLKDTLKKEASAYKRLADEAKKESLKELEKMLRHEAKSRIDISDSL